MIFNATLRGFIRKEFRQTLRDKRMRIVLFIAPIVQLSIFGLALSNDVRNVRLAAQFQPNDKVMSDLYDRAIASSWFIPAKVQNEDPFSLIHNDQSDAVIVAPPRGLTWAVENGHGEIQLLVNAKNALRAQAIENYIVAVARQVVPGPRLPLQFKMRVLYNPTLETSTYMVPGVMGMLVCLVTIVLTSMSLTKEREMGTLETLIAAPVKKWEVIAGKTLPYILLGLGEVPLILLVVVLIFDVPVRGPLILLLIATLFFVTTTVSIGVFISTIARSQQQSMLGGFLFLFPAILLSGVMFPLENMPWALRMFAYVDPLMHFVALMRNILLKQGELSFFLHHLLVLIILAGAILTLAVRRFSTRL
jgi:ABC-2 type transport system permease protein